MGTNTEFRLTQAVTIANGATTSNAVSLNDYFLCALDMPAMTGTTVTFEGTTGDINSGTYRAIKDNTNTALSVTTDATGAIRSVNPQNFAGIKYIRLVSGSSEGAERTIQLLGYRG